MDFCDFIAQNKGSVYGWGVFASNYYDKEKKGILRISLMEEAIVDYLIKNKTRLKSKEIKILEEFIKMFKIIKEERIKNKRRLKLEHTRLVNLYRMLDYEEFFSKERNQISENYNNVYSLDKYLLDTKNNF